MRCIKTTTLPTKPILNGVGNQTAWPPPRDEWDFRSIPPEQCRAACHWEYARSIEPRITSAEDYMVQKGEHTVLGRLLILGGNLSIPWVTLHNEISKLMAIDNLKNPVSLVAQWKKRADPLASFLWDKISKETRQELRKRASNGTISQRAQTQLVEDINRILRGECIHNDSRFAQVKLENETYWLLKDRPRGQDLIRLNRMLLEDAFPLELSRDRSLQPPQWKLYNVWSGQAILATPTAEVKKAVLEAVAGGVRLKTALDVYLHERDYLLAADFYHHGTTTVVAKLKSWARKEAKKFPGLPRGNAAEFHYKYLKWLAAYRLEKGRRRAKVSFDEVQTMLRAEDRGRADCPATLPIYASQGAWSKATCDAARQIKLFETKPETFEQKILF